MKKMLLLCLFLMSSCTFFDKCYIYNLHTLEKFEVQSCYVYDGYLVYVTLDKTEKISTLATHLVCQQVINDKDK